MSEFHHAGGQAVLMAVELADFEFCADGAVQRIEAGECNVLRKQ